MKKTILLRVTFSLTILGVLSFFYLDKQNEVTKIRMEIPVLAKEIQGLSEQVTRLEYQVERFENPQNLMQLAECVDFAHLKYPSACDVWILPEPHFVAAEHEKSDPVKQFLPRSSATIGAHHH